MGKLIGVCLILAGCAGNLFCWRQGQYRRQQLLSAWIRLFARWGFCLQKERMRLCDFLSVYDSGMPELQAFLLDIREALLLREEPDGRKIWQKQLLSHKKSLLLYGEQACILMEAADAFFGTESRECLRCASAAQERLEKELALFREQTQKKYRVYAPVGMLAGLAVIILLI